MVQIKIFAMDVDGTLTDGKIYIGETGEIMKAFSVKDGQGIVLLQQVGIIPAIITARYSRIVQNRAKELDIQEIYQGQKDKVAALTELCEKHHITPGEVAYIGDDLGDLAAIRFCGLSFCPADAAQIIKAAVTHVLSCKGGEGAVREAAEMIMAQQE